MFPVKKSVLELFFFYYLNIIVLLLCSDHAERHVCWNRRRGDNLPTGNDFTGIT